MENSKIEWTDHTANFWWGCQKVSPGCQHCYAETLSHRFGKNIWGPVKTTDRELKENIWRALPKWHKKAKADDVRRRVFVQSMSDFFEDHPQVVETRIRAMRLIEELDALDFLILTKRPENVKFMTGAWMTTGWPKNVWLGTSVENQEMADTRIPELLEIPARVRFLSMEPLLGPVDLSGRTVDGVWIDQEYANIPDNYEMRGIVAEEGWPISWVIVGGESGPHARPMHPDWVRAVLDQCREAGVPFFFKQWGEWIDSRSIGALSLTACDDYEKCEVGYGPFAGQKFVCDFSFFDHAMVKVGKHAAGRLLDGVEYSEFPRWRGD